MRVMGGTASALPARPGPRAGSLAGGLAGGLAGWLAGRLAGWLAAPLAVWGSCPPRPQAGCGAGWAEASACVQAHPLSSTPAANDAREERAHLFFGREAEDEVLEALELDPAEVLGEDVGGEVVGRCPQQADEVVAG